MARDELIDHQTRAKKLALSACTAAQNHSRERLWMIWTQHRQAGVRAEYRDRVLDGVEQIAELKNDLRRLDEKNKRTASENEELRRFTMDGYMIAKSVQELADEREKMMADMDSKNR